MYSNENYLLELLTEAGAIDAGTLDAVRAELSPLDSVIDYLVKNNYLTPEYIAQVAAYNSAMEYVDLGAFDVDPNIIAGVNGELLFWSCSNRKFKMHPAWGAFFFPASLFIDEPAGTLL